MENFHAYCFFIYLVHLVSKFTYLFICLGGGLNSPNPENRRWNNRHSFASNRLENMCCIFGWVWHLDVMFKDRNSCYIGVNFLPFNTVLLIDFIQMLSTTK